MSAPGNARSTTGRGDWETPQSIFDDINYDLQLNIDAAARSDNTKLPRYLSGPHTRQNCDCFWCHRFAPTDRIWVNPPYGQRLPGWIEHFSGIMYRDAPQILVALLPAVTDTAWFTNLWPRVQHLVFIQPRIQFVGTESSNPSGSMLAIYEYDQHTRIVSTWDYRSGPLNI